MLSIDQCYSLKFRLTLLHRASQSTHVLSSISQFTVQCEAIMRDNVACNGADKKCPQHLKYDYTQRNKLRICVFYAGISLSQTVELTP